MNTKDLYQKYSTEDYLNQIEQGQGQSLSSEELYAMICQMDSQYSQEKELASMQHALNCFGY